MRALRLGRFLDGRRQGEAQQRLRPRALRRGQQVEPGEERRRIDAPALEPLEYLALDVRVLVCEREQRQRRSVGRVAAVQEL